MVPGAVHPVSAVEAIAAARQRARGFPRERLRELLPKVDDVGAGDARVQQLVKLMAYAASIEGAAIAALSRGRAWFRARTADVGRSDGPRLRVA